MMLETKDFFSQIKENDKKAFEEVFHQYYGVMCSLANRYLRDSDSAEEVVCHIFYQLWEKRHHLDVESSLKNYLIRSVHNRCLNTLRRKKVEQRYQDELSNNTVASVESLTPHNSIQKTEIESIIKDVVEALPNQCQKIFKMSREENLTNKEISEKLNISINTVKTQLSRGTNRLKSALKDYLTILL